MTSYLEKATDDITNAIPDENFSGLVIIDWEFWSPIWGENFWPERRVYTEESIAFVQRHHPDWDAAKVESVAKLEFETAGKALFEATVKLGKLLRPGGLWGFYHYPYCENNVRHVGRCNATAMKHNDQLRWLFDDTTAIYPSIYLKSADVGLNGSSAFVDATLGEAFRVREKSDNPLMPMYSYCRFNYSHTKYYYTMVSMSHRTLKKTMVLSFALVCHIKVRAKLKLSPGARCHQLMWFIGLPPSSQSVRMYAWVLILVGRAECNIPSNILRNNYG